MVLSAPTPTATLASTLPLLTDLTTAAALATAWSAPASCATPVLRSWVGDCTSNTCTVPATIETLGPLLWANWPYQISFGVWTSTECFPPGWNGLEAFAFHPATGCPSGYTTATIGRYRYATGYDVATCCPSAYTLSAVAEGTSIVAGVCESYHAVFSGEPYLDVAFGLNTASVRTVSAGATVTTTRQWSTESFIRVATATTATSVAVWHPQVRVLLPAPSSSSPPLPGGTGFTAFGLGTVLSIVAVVGIGIGALVILCCCWYCCCHDSNSSYHGKRPPLDTTQYPAVPVPLRNTTAHGPPRPLTPHHPMTDVWQPAPLSTSPRNCQHGRSATCSATRATASSSYRYESTCCACRDSRRPPMTVASRTSTYCLQCQTHWARCTIANVPDNWKSGRAGDPLMAELAARAVEQHKCSHGVVAIGCSRNAPGSKKCCACTDTRASSNTPRLSKAQRIETYCPACQYHWASTPDSSCPAAWLLGCRHGNMAARCLSASSPAAANLSTDITTTRNACCACRDTRPKNMPKQARTRTYCTACATAWNARPDTQCPPEWGLLRPRRDCAHAMALECASSKAGEVWCCACKDGRKFLALEARLGSCYCAPCKQRWWRGVFDGEAEGKVPAAWAVAMKDLPLRKTAESCLPRRPVTTHLMEKEGTHERMFDQGPRYGPVRFGGYDAQEAAEGPATVPGKGKMGLLDVLSITVKPSPPVSEPDDSDYQGYEEKGLQRNGPRFSVPINATPGSSVRQKRMGSVSDLPATGGVSAETRPLFSSPRLGEAQKRIREDQKGLCVGRKPKFLVPASR